jgi:hypothetical protein
MQHDRQVEASRTAEKPCQPFTRNILRKQNDMGSRHTIQRPQQRKTVAPLKVGAPASWSYTETTQSRYGASVIVIKIDLLLTGGYEHRGKGGDQNAQPQSTIDQSPSTGGASLLIGLSA